MIRLALAQYGIGRPASMDAFAAALDARVVQAVQAGAELLVLPEYACVEVAAAFTNGPDLPGEIEAVRSRADAILAVCRQAAQRHGVWLLAGSLPVIASPSGNGTHPLSNRVPGVNDCPPPLVGGVRGGVAARADSCVLPPSHKGRGEVSPNSNTLNAAAPTGEGRGDGSATPDGGGGSPLSPTALPKGAGATHIRNSAPLISPDGRVGWQDKRVPTPFEAEAWSITAGASPGVFETPWGRVGVCVCYDVEFPSLVRAQVRAGAWLILVPACTDTMAGFNRVRLAARARAIENQCYIAIAPTVGAAPWLVSLDMNRGYAAVFGPCDQGFPEDGVLARGALDQPGWVYADLDRARLDAVRATGAVRNHRDWPDEPPPCPTIPLL